MPTTVDEYRKRINPYWVDALETLGEPPVFVKATGCHLYDDTGAAWLDFVCGYGTALFGHHHPQLLEALSASLTANVPEISPLGIPPSSAALAQQLTAATGLDGYLTWLMGSGSEAIECAVKLALTFTGRTKLICTDGGFHGLSALSIGLTENPFWRVGIESVIPIQTSIAVADMARARELIGSGEYAAIVLEPIQATGGGKIWSKKDAAELGQLCKAHDTLLIADEVQSGIGRCGKFSAMAALGWEVQPDIVVFSKGLTGGLLPLSAMLSRADVFASFFGRPGCAKLHGSTFAGNAHAIAVGLASMKLMQERQTWPPSAGIAALNAGHATLAAQFPELIHTAKIFGSMHFLEMTSPDHCYALFQQLHASKILVSPCMHAPNTFKILPPLNLDLQSANYYMAKLVESLHHIA